METREPWTLVERYYMNLDNNNCLEEALQYALRMGFSDLKAGRKSSRKELSDRICAGLHVSHCRVYHVDMLRSAYLMAFRHTKWVQWRTKRGE